MRRETRLLATALAALSLAAAQEPEPVVVRITTSSIGHVFLSPDARRVVAHAWRNLPDLGAVKLWDVAQNRQETGITTDDVNPGRIACTPDWTVGVRSQSKCNDPNGGGNSFTVSVLAFNPATLATVRTICTFQDGIHGTYLDITPDGKYVAYGLTRLPISGGPPRTAAIRIFETASGKELLCVPAGEWFYGVAISPDGKYVAGVITEAGTPSVRVWDVAAAKLLGTLEGHTGRATAVRFSPDGQWLATVAEDGAAILWNPAKGFARATAFKKGPDQLEAAVFNGDGSLLAVGGKQGVVTVWNTKTKKPAFTFHHPKPKPPAKFNGAINCLSFDKDGKFLAAGAEDGVVLIWPIAATTATGAGTKTEDK